MKIKCTTFTLLLTLSIALFAGCASTHSIVTSSRALNENINEGVVYSLPKQLVKVVYRRIAIDSTEAAAKKKKAKEAVDSTTKAIGKKKKEAVALEKLIRNIDAQAANRAKLEAKLNLDLTKIKAEKLVLTKMLSDQTNVLSIATTEYALSLKSDSAFSEQLSITPEIPITDSVNTFYANVQHQKTSSDIIELRTKNGLLDGAIGHSEDKTGEVLASLAGGLVGLIQPSFLGVGSPKVFNLGIDVSGRTCQKKTATSITQIIDPSVDKDLEALNLRLRDGCIELEIEPDTTRTAQTAAIKKVINANGLIYRQPGIFTFKVKDLDTGTEIQSIRLSLAQGGQPGIITMPKGKFSKNEFDISFSNGALSKSRTVQPSEILGAAKILPNMFKEIFAIPTELIKLKVDYSTSEKELLGLKKVMLEAQVEIDKKQLELEDLAAVEK